MSFELFAGRTVFLWGHAPQTSWMASMLRNGLSGPLIWESENGVGKLGYGNRPPIDDRNPIWKFNIDPLCLQSQWDNSASTDSPWQRIKEKRRYGNSVSRTSIADPVTFCGPRFRSLRGWDLKIWSFRGLSLEASGDFHRIEFKLPVKERHFQITPAHASR